MGCRDQWDMERRYADRLISGAKTAQLVSPTGLKSIAERQIRPLTRLPPEQQSEAWAKAVDTAPDGKVTAKHVAQVVADMLPPREPRTVRVPLPP